APLRARKTCGASGPGGWVAPLQWSRALASAEDLSGGPPSRPHPGSFNGAAPLRARKTPATHPLVKLLTRPLQWSRALASAEDLREGLAAAGGGKDASMEPRPCERGRRPWRGARGTRGDGFNGAAPLRARKTCMRP